VKIRIGDVEFGYDRAGSGDPVLLVMGLGTTRIGWFNQFAYLSQHYDVTAFDNRGCGETVCDGSWTVRDMAADALAIADAMGYGSFHLAGVSMGGMISQEVALAAPDRIRTLTLISTSPGGPQAPPPSPEYLAAFMLPDATDRVARSIEMLFGSRYRAEHADVVQAAVTFAVGGGRATPGFSMFDGEANQAGFMAQLTAVMTWTTSGGAFDRLPQIATPALVMHGGEDLLLPVGNGKLIAERIPGARLRIWDDAGHALVHEHADEVNEELSRHLSAAAVDV
jgi:pimeloyl-ACP methyl ester carboxylesterase